MISIEAAADIGRSAVSVNCQVSSSGATDMSSSTMYATPASVAAQSPQSPSDKVVESKEVMRNGFPIEAKVVDRVLSDSTSAQIPQNNITGATNCSKAVMLHAIEEESPPATAYKSILPPEVANLKILPKKERKQKSPGHWMCKVDGCCLERRIICVRGILHYLQSLVLGVPSKRARVRY